MVTARTRRPAGRTRARPTTVTKPFSVRELVLRAGQPPPCAPQAVGRRRVVVGGDVRMDIARHEVTVRGDESPCHRRVRAPRGPAAPQEAPHPRFLIEVGSRLLGDTRTLDVHGSGAQDRRTPPPTTCSRSEDSATARTEDTALRPSAPPLGMTGARRLSVVDGRVDVPRWRFASSKGRASSSCSSVRRSTSSCCSGPRTRGPVDDVVARAGRIRDLA
jgi:hypothetical protein